MNTILKVEKLSHKYSATWAIRDLNFEINGKGAIGLLGSNGAGKSTTMNIITGVLNQTEGNVFINGINKDQNPRLAKKQLGFLPQVPPLYADFTVNEFLTFAADLRRIDKMQTKKAVSEVMDKTGLAHFSSRLIKNLSGGYRQRVGIAQAIIHKPAIVILDEPTNGLDPNQVIEARKLIKEIATDHTVMISSHVLSEISMMCNNIIMIEGGRIVFSDSMDAFNNYIMPQTLIVKMENLPPETELMKVEGVTKVQYLDHNKFRIHFVGSTDISESIILKSVQQNWQLEEIVLEKTLLDDVFKQLSNQP